MCLLVCIIKATKNIKILYSKPSKTYRICICINTYHVSPYSNYNFTCSYTGQARFMVAHLYCRVRIALFVYSARPLYFELSLNYQSTWQKTMTLMSSVPLSSTHEIG